MQPLDQGSLQLTTGNFVYMEISYANTPGFGPSKADWMSLFNDSGLVPFVKLLSMNPNVLIQSIPGQNDDYFLFQLTMPQTGDSLFSAIQAVLQQAGTSNWRMDSVEIVDAQLLEAGDTNPLNSSQVVGADGTSFTRGDPNSPSWLCQNVGIGCSGGFNFSTVLIVLAIAIGLIAVAYTTKTIRGVVPA